MVDRTLSDPAIPLGTTSDYLYGIESSTSRKYAGLRIFNVKNNYGGFGGAVGNGINDDRNAIQAAINAGVANGGGIIFFPPGNYKVNSAIIFDFDSVAALRIIGSGGNSQFGGTNISTASQIYIFYCHNTGGQGGNQPIASIEHISFTNSYNPGAHGTITSTELSGGGFGCIYQTAGSNVTIASCGFSLPSGGIALFANVITLAVNSCNFFGPFGLTHAEDSYGIIANSVSIRDIKIVAFGVAITSSAPGLVSYLMMDGGDVEVNGCAIRLGYIPIAQWDPFQNATATGNSIATAHIRNVGFESNGDSDGSSNAAGGSVAAVIDIYQTQACVLENLKSQNIARSQANGIAIYNASGLVANNVVFAGGSSFGFTTAAINIRSGGDYKFFNVTGSAGSFGGHGSDWITPTGWGGGTLRGITFDGCKNSLGGFDGAMTLANLSFPFGSLVGARVIVSDSVDTAYSGGVSNFGKTITGGGTHKVVGSWNGSNWTIGG